VTNVRNASSQTGPDGWASTTDASVPVTSFAKRELLLVSIALPTWFARNMRRPIDVLLQVFCPEARLTDFRSREGLELLEQRIAISWDASPFASSSSVILIVAKLAKVSDTA